LQRCESSWRGSSRSNRSSKPAPEFPAFARWASCRWRVTAREPQRHPWPRWAGGAGIGAPGACVVSQHPGQQQRCTEGTAAQPPPG
jgi:hypothetical protein